MYDPLEADPSTLRRRAAWRFRGSDRPAFASIPQPDEESVWDYPRPPRIVRDLRRVEVFFDGQLLADSRNAVRVLETASPPTFYLPPPDVCVDRLVPSGRDSFCEWKGIAIDFDLIDGPGSVAWRYDRVFSEFDSIAGWYAFYPSKLDCRVDGERVRPQPGGYYGGWITKEIVGPVKGDTRCLAD